MVEKIKTCTNYINKAAIIKNLNFYKLQLETRVGMILSNDINTKKKCKKKESV